MYNEEGMNIMASIYITGHPDDLEQQSEIIDQLAQEELFDAIRYENEAEVPIEELKPILSEMHLILVFVSSKLLYTPNIARDFIIPYAEKKQIPVIAYSLEKYIEYDFRKQYGNMLFFDPYKEEIYSSVNNQFVVMVKMLLTVGMQQSFLELSDIPNVLQKLAEMNKSGLIFRESFMMAIIWQAKAMTQAQNAYMQSGTSENLHKWMDECCVLGDFLRGLKREHEALSIYQSLLSHLQSEQPDQQLLQYTLLGKIGYAYEGLHQDEKAYESFSDALRIASSLVKSEKAIEERAHALSDIQMLCKKLGDLYYEADQYSNALNYYQIYLDFQKMMVEKSEYKYGRQGLADIYECIASAYHISGQTEFAETFYLKCIPIRRSLYNENPNQPSMQDYSMCLRKLGEVYIDKRDTDSAMHCYQEALEINQKLSECSMSYQTTLNMIILCFKLGDLYLVLENLNEAEKYYYKCLVMAADLSSRSGAIEAQEQLMDANLQLGQIARAKGEYENALNYVRNAARTGSELSERRKTTEIQMRIARAYSMIGDLLLEQNNIPEAGQNYSKSLDIFTDIASKNGDVNARRYAAVQIENIGDIHRANGNYETAEECYLEEQNIMEVLASELDTYEIQSVLSSCYKNLGVLALAKKDYERTDSYYQKALKICQHLVETAPHPEAKQSLASTYHDCAILYRDKGQLRKSKNYFDKALSIRRELADTYHTVMYYHNLALTLLEFAKLREQQHQFPDIRTYSTEALQICEKLAVDAPSFSTDDILADALEAVGSFYARYGSEPEFGIVDVELYSRAIKLRENIANTSQQVRDWDRLALLYYNSSLDIISPSWQKIMLYEALDTWQYLAERTKDSKYDERCEHAKRAIRYYQLDDNNDS